MSYIDELNEEQLKPVLDTEGPVLVFAGAGSGKTRVLTTRIAHLVNDLNVPPFNILAITFTNKAAKEMNERLAKICDTNGMWISTIHKMCVKILRTNIKYVGFEDNFTIFDASDQEKAIKRIVSEMNLDAEKYLKNALNQISLAKNDYLSPDEYESVHKDYRDVKIIAEIYRKYQDYLHTCNAFDFDDILVKAYELLTNNPEVRDYYQEKFKYIHVDEFQDTNKIQFLIIRLLAFKSQNIFCVGDDDQSIYGWRGAKIENILNFAEFFPTVKKYKLEKNYRSTKTILDLANKVIAHNSYRNRKVLWTDNNEGANVESYIAPDETAESYYVAAKIKNLVNVYGYNYSDFAVLMRVNALSRAFEQEFNKYGISYKVFGGFKFYERKEIKDIVAYMKFINNKNDNESFLRIINNPKRGIGEKSLLNLLEFAKANNISAYSAIKRIDETGISSASKLRFQEFYALLEDLTANAKESSVDVFTQYLIDKVGFKLLYPNNSEENINRRMNIDEFQNSVDEFIATNGVDTTLNEFLNSISLATDTDEINETDSVSIATIHSVKGLEYKCVFIVGLDESVFPISRAIMYQNELEEERRLMYVAITRAKERLFLTRAMSRFLFGQRNNMVISRFMKECLPEQIKVTPKSTSVYKEYSNNSSNFSNNANNYNYYRNSQSNAKSPLAQSADNFLNQSKGPTEQIGVDYSKFKIGVVVNHKRFGEGTIIAVKGEGESILVDVAFKGVGIKSLSAKYAPMEVIDG